VDAVARAARSYLPGMDDLETVEIWRGLRPCPPDGLPIIARPQSLENVVVATGHAMLGMSLAPITGKLVGQLVRHEPPALDLTPLRMERFL
nr:FAD-binding oxidoreductase [Chloroflexota bacterium]